MKEKKPSESAKNLAHAIMVNLGVMPSEMDMFAIAIDLDYFAAQQVAAEQRSSALYSQEFLIKRINEAVAEEREACAKMVENETGWMHVPENHSAANINDSTRDLAASIRARGNQ